MKDATDYLNTEEARGYLERERMRVLEDAKLHPEKYQDANGNLDPAKVEAEIQRQQLAMRETLMYDLPDKYLSPEELSERQERQKEPEEQEAKELLEELLGGWHE